MTGTAEVFDLAALLRRCMDDPELALALVERFTSRLDSTVESIGQLVDAKNWSVAASTVHSVKGEAGSLAVAELHAAAEELEQSLRVQNEAEIAPNFDRFKEAAATCVGASAGTLQKLSELAAATVQP